jgi:hypothetical protein
MQTQPNTGHSMSDTVLVSGKLNRRRLTVTCSPARCEHQQASSLFPLMHRKSLVNHPDAQLMIGAEMQICLT